MICPIGSYWMYSSAVLVNTIGLMPVALILYNGKILNSVHRRELDMVAIKPELSP